MPESKKLSELIDELIFCRIMFEHDRSIGEIYKDRGHDLKNQIDQKFEELRCECKKEKWEVPSLKNIKEYLIEERWKDIENEINEKIKRLLRF